MFCFASGPTPAPFCDNAAKQPENVTIVPMRNASFLNPSIKVRVGVDSGKRYSNGSEIGISESCKNGTTQEILHYNEAILKPGETKTFSATQKKNKICGKYEAAHPFLVKEQCYDFTPMPGPIIKSFNNNTFNIKHNQKNTATGLFLIKQTVNEKREFQYDKSTGKLQDNPNGNIFCIQRENPANDYYIMRNGSIVRFKEVDSAFVPVIQ